MKLNEKAIRNIVNNVMNKIRGKSKRDYPKDGNYWINSKGQKMPYWYTPDTTRHPYETQEDEDLRNDQYDYYGKPINRPND